MAQATRPGRTAPRSSSATRCVAAWAPRSGTAGARRSAASGRTWRCCRGDDQHEPQELVAALDTLLARHADYVQGSRWMRGGRVVGPAGNRAAGTRIYSLVFSVLTLRRITDATNGFRILRTEILA